MMARRSVLLVTGIIALSGILCSGCSYMQKRGNDALDMFDIGVTVSQTPGFSLYSSCFEIFTVGYSNVDGRFHGLCRRRVGSFPLRHNATGVLVWGYEQLGYDEVDFADPDSPESWRVGPLGLILGPGPDKAHVMNCPKLLHLGWAGIAINCKLADIADFILGWTTLDIMGDDVPD